jgi:hypothetical protein
MLHHPALLDDGADEHRHPDLAAIPGAERHVLDEVALRRHGGLHALRHLRAGVLAEEEEVVLPQHIVLLVAAHPHEGIVGVDDRVAGDLRVGDHHRHAGGLDRGDEGAIARLDVAQDPSAAA